MRKTLAERTNLHQATLRMKVMKGISASEAFFNVNLHLGITALQVL